MLITEIFKCTVDDTSLRISEMGAWYGDNIWIDIVNKDGNNASFAIYDPEERSFSVDDLLVAFLKWRNEKHIPYSPELKEILKTKYEEVK